MSFSISYGNSIDKAREILMDMIGSEEKILKDPEPFIGLHKMSESSIDITVRVWVKAEDYWGIYFGMNDKVYKTFPQQGLTFPFPQMDVHMYNQ